VSPKARKAEGVALVAAVIMAVCGAGLGLLAYQNRSAANWMLLAPAAASVLVWLFVWFHLRMRRAAWEEERDLKELREKRKDVALFEQEGGEDLLSSRSRLRAFEKYAVPIFGLLLALAAFAFALFAWQRVLPVEKPPAIAYLLQSSLAMIVAFLVSYFLGQYAAGMAREPEWRLLRAGAGFNLGLGAGALLAIAGFVAVHFETPGVERVMAYILPGLLVAAGLDIVANQILDFYRPRVAGQEWRPAYDSRIFGLLAAPASILKTIADTLDYQFGFKVSDTWFYRFMTKAIAPLVLFQLVSFYLLTSFVVIGAEEEAVVERFGRPLPGTLGPGLHLKLPWPMDVVYREPARRVREIVLGHEKKPHEILRRKDAKVEAILWTQTHFGEEHHFLMASRGVESGKTAPPDAGTDKSPPEAGASSAPKETKTEAVPVNLVSGQVAVHYTVKNLRDWLYRHEHREALLENLAHREFVRYLAGEDLLALLGDGRKAAGDALRAAVQAACDRQKLGVEILFVGLQGVHPPLKPSRERGPGKGSEVGAVGLAFENVASEEQKKLAAILRAKGEATVVVTLTQADRAARLSQAEAYAARRTTVTKAAAAAFADRLKAYRVAPGVYEIRKRLEAVEAALAEARKFIVPSSANLREVMILDWDEKLMTDDLLGVVKEEE
jgi:regulator of protease activity HflC (stomatin/prohibitin superfamily)